MAKNPRFRKLAQRRNAVLGVRVTPDDREMVSDLARRVGCSQADLIVGLAREELERLEAEEKAPALSNDAAPENAHAFLTAKQQGGRN